MSVSDMHKDIASKLIEIYLAAAKKSAPYIGDNGNWYVWDINAGTHIDTGVKGDVSEINEDIETIYDDIDYIKKFDIPRVKAELNGLIDKNTEKMLELTNKVAPSPASVTLYADRWEQGAGETMWHQEVVVANATITPYSKVDLQLSAEQIAVFYEKDLAFVTENDNGVVTVYCIGRVPENDYVIQATVSEVVVNV